MNKIFLSCALSFVGLSAFAQGGYDAGNIIQNDLNGTARYVGMGGALNALGADLSTMSSNPAGTGLFRKSDVSFTASCVITGEAGQVDMGRSRASVDNGGVVFAFPVDNSGSGLQFVNVGVNYRKNRNFFGNNMVGIKGLGTEGNYSQTFQLASLCNDAYSAGDMSKGLAYMSAPFTDDDRNIVDDEGNPVDCSVVDYYNGAYQGVGAQAANYYRSTYGNNSEIDMNVAINVSDRFYAGVTFGIYSLNYFRNSFYEELAAFPHQDDGTNHYYDFSNSYVTSGSGFDIKLGFICRPIEASPFRVGISVSTPAWYRLTDANSSMLYVDNQYISSLNSGDYDYNFRTPWRFNLSLGHTIGNKIALGAEYEFCNYASAHYSDINGNSLSIYNDDKDEHNGDVKSVLKIQHIAKFGVEYKPLDWLSLRLGYNYVSSAYKNNKRNWLYYDSDITDTDYTNWHGINRITCGVGFRWNGGYFDIAYQYQGQKGDFYAFSTSNNSDNQLQASTIKNNRSQIMGTLGFRF